MDGVSGKPRLKARVLRMIRFAKRLFGVSGGVALLTTSMILSAGDPAPEYLSINSDAEEYSPVLTDSGALYFASDREGGPGRGDLYRAACAGSWRGIEPA